MLSTPFISNPIRTNDIFTIGLVNLPIVLKDGKPVKSFDSKKGRDKYEVIPDMRYPYYELDYIRDWTHTDNIMYKIVDAYSELKLPVYVHRTMRGYHFICIVAIHKDCYAQWIKPLMKYNPKCPMVTLRIKPNKWVNEKEIFKQGSVISNGASDMAIAETEKIKTWIEHQFIGLLQMNYYVVRYKMTGELGNL